MIYAKAFFDLQLQFAHNQFRERLERQSSLDSLEQCFPFQVLSVDALVQDFDDFYGV